MANVDVKPSKLNSKKANGQGSRVGKSMAVKPGPQIIIEGSSE